MEQSGLLRAFPPAPQSLGFQPQVCSSSSPSSPLQDFLEHYVQTGPGQLFVGSTQRFLHDSLGTALRCNHSIQYDAARGPQPQLVQHLRASAISSAFDPEAEALQFQLTTALQAGEAPSSVSTPCSG